MPLSIAQKTEIKARSATESSSRLAQEFGVSRARVRQIGVEDPKTWRDYTNTQPLKWKAKGLKQAQISTILSSELTIDELARAFKVPRYRVERVRHSQGIFRNHRSGTTYKPLTQEQTAEAIVSPLRNASLAKLFRVPVCHVKKVRQEHGVRSKSGAPSKSELLDLTRRMGDVG